MAYERMNLQDLVDKWTAANVKHIEDGILMLEDMLENLSRKVVTVVIDLSDSNPDTCCSYEDDAADITNWDEFFGHYPVLMKDGTEVVKLNPLNYTQDISGNAVDIESGDAGDVMIAFPRRGLKIISTDDDKIRISFTNMTNDSDYKYYAHQHNNNELDKFYVGAYNGYIDDNGKLRSLSGKTPASDITIGQSRAAAQANGDSYEQFAWFQLVYLQAMYIMKYKSLNGQTTLGVGCVEADAALATGTMNDKGLDWGIPYTDDTTDGTQGMKFAGIENFWGSIFNWVDGIVTDENCNYLITNNTFNDTGENYEITALVDADQITENGYLEDYLCYPVGTSEGGFAIKKMVGGSETTYFSDGAGAVPSGVAYFGGCWDGRLRAGPFFFYVIATPSDAYPFVGGRVQKL